MIDIDQNMILMGSSLALAGSVAYKAFLEQPRNERDWMTLKDAKQYGLVGNERTGIIIGSLNGVTLADKSSSAFGVNGPPGTGKSAGLIKTLQLNTRYSMLISDPSGELWRLTSGIRSTYGPVYRLDPSELNTSLLNPLDEILYSDNMYAELSNMFRSLIVTQDKVQAKSDPHWTDKPVELAPAYSMQLQLGRDPSRKNMASLLRFIRSGRAALQEMRDNPSHPKCREVAEGLLSEIGTGQHSPYLGSLISVLSQPLSMWDDINVCKMTEASSFRLDQLAADDSEGPITVYMTAPAKDKDRLMPFNRLVGYLLKSHLLYRKQVTLRGEQKRRCVLNVIDECQDEAPEKLDKTLAICRKFGYRCATGFQSLDAAEALYGKHFMGLLKSKLTYRPTTGDDVVRRLSAMSGFYEKEKVSETEDRKHMAWRKSSRRKEKEWKPRMEAWDFERLPEFGIAMYTHTKKPALVKTTDAEQDLAYRKYLLPEYELPEPRRLRSPWENDVPTVMTQSQELVSEPSFRDEHSIGDEDDDDDVVVM